MGEESVKGANLGVILIIFAAILALGLIVFMLARNMANTGLTNVSEKLQAAEESEFTDFDGSVVVGQRVHAALSGFKGKKVAVLIATQGFTDKLEQAYAKEIPSTHLKDSFKLQDGTNGLLSSTANIGGRKFKVAYAVATKPDGSAGDAMGTKKSNGVNAISTFIQYNALLESTDNKGNISNGDKDTNGNSIGHSVIRYDNGTYIFDGSFRTFDGKVVSDYDFSNLSKTGLTEMVPGAARFHANLLKDANGVILGVVFQQVGQ